MTVPAKTNKFGLNRDIPAHVKRMVRRGCGFGCIFCGEAICQYEHIEPFKRIREHHHDNIALLCGTCHDKVTRGVIPKEEVRKRRVQPYRHSRPWASTALHPSALDFPVVLGGAKFLNPRTVLRILGRDLLSCREPEEDGAPIRLSAEFYDDQGEASLSIEDNECKLNPRSWDIESKGTRFIIRSAPRAVVLRIRLDPTKLVVERLEMQYGDVQLQANPREFKVLTKTRRGFALAGTVRSPDTGIQINRKAYGRDGAEVRSLRQINVLGSGGDYTITGRQPAESEISFCGSARRLTIDADATVTVRGSPRTRGIGLALSDGAALNLSLEDLEVLIGVGARRSEVSLR